MAGLFTSCSTGKKSVPFPTLSTPPNWRRCTQTSTATSTTSTSQFLPLFQWIGPGFFFLFMKYYKLRSKSFPFFLFYYWRRTFHFSRRRVKKEKATIFKSRSAEFKYGAVPLAILGRRRKKKWKEKMIFYQEIGKKKDKRNRLTQLTGVHPL